jgi:hypothetical protein
MDINQIIIALISLFSGGLGQYMISTKLMPKKEQKDADQNFINTLIQRVSLLEGRIEEQSAQIANLMASNATLLVELNYMKVENESLKKEKEGK